MTPEEFKVAMHKKADAIERNLKVAENASATQALQIFTTLSSGPYSLRQLALMGHPYAQRQAEGHIRLVTGLDPSVINVQTGQFRSSWIVIRCHDVNGNLVTKIINTSPDAKWMLGTKKMKARRIDSRVAKAIKVQRNHWVRIALKQGLKT